MCPQPAAPDDRDRRRPSSDGPERLLRTIIALDVRRRPTVEAIASALGVDATAASLRGIPDLDLVGEHVVISDLVIDAAAPPDSADLELATRVAVERSMDAGDVSEAGRLAVAGGSDSALRAVVRAALATQPPRVSAHDLRSWRDSGVLATDDPHAWWLDAACRVLLEGPSPELAELYGATGAAFAAADDAAAEIAVGMAAAIVARRSNDLVTLAAFIGRANEMVGSGVEAARAPSQLGAALVHQMAGDPVTALEVLDAISPDSLEGDWAAQLSMMRGTNLMLLDRTDEAVAHLSLATGSGSTWSYSVALELGALAQWRSGNRVDALRDLETAEVLARSVGATVDAGRMHAQRAAMLAAEGDVEEAVAPMLAAAQIDPGDDETDRLLQVAATLASVVAGDVDAATESVRRIDPPARALPSTYWVASLQSALVPSGAERWRAVAETHPALAPAVKAGSVAAAHLDGGPLAPSSARPYLPAAWCEHADPVVEVRLLGGATVLRDRLPVQQKTWERGRVRELCCYLALVEDSSRELAGERLWPDLSSDAAARNLRVTLSYLLDVLEPDRDRGAGSELVSEQGGTIRLSHEDRLRVDVRELLERSRGVLNASAAGDDRSLLREARRLARLPRGALLGGAQLGAWVEPYEQARRELVLRAVSAGGPAVLRVGDTDLAEALARRGLDEDPWAERLHQLVVRSCLARDDLDAARRAMRQALAVIAELEVQPERATLDLARQIGFVGA